MPIIEHIKDRTERIEKARAALQRSERRIEVILDAISAVDDLLDSAHKRLIRLRKDKQQQERTEEQRNEFREQLADQVDEERAHKDRLLEKLDDLRADRADARQVIEKNIRRVVQLRERRRRIREDKAGQLTPHFHVAEFDCHDGTPVPKQSYAALKAHCQTYLEPLRAQYGVVHVNSGFRTKTYNASIGGATMSIHVYDADYQHDPFAVAVDHWAEGAAPPQVQDWHEAHTHPDGMGRYGTFTHVDNRNRIGWADSRWVGP